jgi:branched-chain amino acid transport system substrate-binding protein
MAAAYTMVEALKNAGKDLTRDSLIRAVDNLNVTTNPFLLPGIVVKTGPSDHFPLNQVYLQQWTKTGWKQFGGMLTYRGP